MMHTLDRFLAINQDNYYCIFWIKTVPSHQKFGIIMENKDFWPKIYLILYPFIGNLTTHITKYI